MNEKTRQKRLKESAGWYRIGGNMFITKDQNRIKKSDGLELVAVPWGNQKAPCDLCVFGKMPVLCACVPVLCACVPCCRWERRDGVCKYWAEGCEGGEE